MNLQEIIKRLAELDEEVRSATDVAAIEKCEEEKKSLLAKKAELEALEERREKALNIQNGTASANVVGISGRNKDKAVEVRNTLAYGRAFLKGDVAECRSLLSANVSGGSVPVPEVLENEIKNAWEECQVLSLAKKSYYKGNVTIGFEYSATGAVTHTEGDDAPEEETLVWGKVELKAQNIKKWITVSDEAIENTTIDTLNEIYKEVAQRIVEEAEDIAVGKIVAAPATSTSTACGVPVYTAATIAIDSITLAVAEVSGKAKNLVAIMNRRTEAAFKAAAKNANYSVDPFDGITVVRTDALKAFSAATTGETYVIIGDFGYGFQANLPNGDDVTLKVDDISLAEEDLVKIVGKQFVGMDVVAPKAFVKIKK